jgi:hypothetical protein
MISSPLDQYLLSSPFQQRNTFFPEDKIGASSVVLAAKLVAQNGNLFWQRAYHSS